MFSSINKKKDAAKVAELESILLGYKNRTSGQCQHHIIPKSWGGSDDCDNLVWCSNKEHLDLHILYSEAFPDDIHMRRARVLMESIIDSQGEIVSAYERLGMTHQEFSSKIRSMVESGLTVNKIAQELGTTHKSISKYVKLDPDLCRENFRKAVSGPKGDRHKLNMKKPKSERHRESMKRGWRYREKIACSGCGRMAYKHHLTRYHKNCRVDEDEPST